MGKHQDPQKKKASLNIVLSLMLLFLAVILTAHTIRHFQEGAAVLSKIISICGALLFGGVGLCLLAGEVRQWLHLHK